jgi:outer membrane biosynthesis protein TonB
MRSGLTISCIGHGVALGLGLVAISAQPMESPPVTSLPVQFISEKDFSQLTQGVKNAPKLKVDDPKPLADKVDQPKPVDQTADKVGKQDIKTETAAAKPQPQPKPADKPDKPKTPDYRPDQIAQLLKKDANKQPPKQDQPTPDKATQDKATQDAPKFDADQVAALLDHRDPQRQFAAADTVNQTVGVGSATGTSAQLSQSEIDALRARISSCWSPPPGVDAKSKLYIVLDVLFKPDANLAREPAVVEGSASSLGPALAESAKRALLLCQPFSMLKPEHYEQWKNLQLKFDPQELLGG